MIKHVAARQGVAACNTADSEGPVNLPVQSNSALVISLLDKSLVKRKACTELTRVPVLKRSTRLARF